MNKQQSAPRARFARYLALGCAVALIALTPSAANAANGINLIGFGVESNLLAGADVAVARDTGALNTNPAGLAQISARAFDFHFGAGDSSAFRHEDRLGNDRKVSNKHILVAEFGYARKLSDPRLTLAFGLFAQGGAGYVYRDLLTPFGTRDELSSLLRIAKLIPAFAYQASDRLSLGLALPISIADLRQKIFPDTSVPAPVNFFGAELSDARGVAIGARLGAQYRVNDKLKLGLTYGNKTEITLKDAHLRLNMSAAGLGYVNYRDARVEGLALPQEIGVGVALQPNQSWLLSVKLAWLDWSNALISTTTTASDPDNPGAPPRVQLPKVSLNWRDQYVFALGLAYELSERTTLMGGFNYGRNPIPNETTNPLFASFGERHVTFGVLRRLGAQWQLAAGVEYDFKKAVTYDNPETPFGPGARESGELIALHLGLRRRW